MGKIFREKNFLIAGFRFKLCYDPDINIPINFLKFEQTDGITEYRYEIMISDELSIPEGNLIARREDILIFRFKDLESRLIGMKGSSDYYASYQEISDKLARITIRIDKLEGLHIDPIFSSLFAFERRLVIRNSLIFHCAYLCHQEEAILFSAPSGGGKSTQADLWEKYQNGKIINGDRAVLRKISGNWITEGWPVSGTSGICQNISMPVKAIVMLSQSTDNQVRKLTKREAVQLLYAQITINYWNKENITKTLDLLDEIVTQIPIYHFACNISKEAVTCLKKVVDSQNKKYEYLE
jgi:hypothetical protein